MSASASSEPQLIQSPAIPLSTPLHIFKEGQQVAFIYNRLTAVPATITELNPDGTYDIIAAVPTSIATVKFSKNQQDFKRKQVVQMVDTSFLAVRVGDPTIIYVKVGIPLDNPQIDTARGIHQTHIDRFQDSGRRLRTPKFHEFHTNIISNIFDPALYLYKIWAWRAEMEVEKGVKIPEENRTWPKEGHYDNFPSTFNKYFKEAYGKVGKWNRVEIQVFLKADIDNSR